MAKKAHSSRQASSQTLHAQTLTTPPTSSPQPPSPSNSSRPNTRSKNSTPATAAKAAKSRNPFPANDVLLILKGLLDFKTDTRLDPTKHHKAFHDSLKDSLSIESTVRKLSDKVRKLKLKFDKTLQKNEKGLTFSSSHEKEVFELSQKFWGQEKSVEEREKLPPKPKKKKDVAKKPQKEEFAKGESSDERGQEKIVEEKEKLPPKPKKKKDVAKKPEKEEFAKGESSDERGQEKIVEEKEKLPPKPKKKKDVAKKPEKEEFAKGESSDERGQEKIVEEKEKLPPKPNKKDVAKEPEKEEFAKGESSDDLNLCKSFYFDKMFMGVNVNVLKRGMELLEEAEREELETRVKKLKVREIELFAMRSELVKEQTRLILNKLDG